MRNLFLCLSIIMVSAASVFLFSACKDEDDNNDSADSKVFEPTSNPYGTSYTDWTVQWMQSFLTFDCDNNPFANPANVLFSQTGDVYFMAGLQATGSSVNITVPQDKAILFPLANYINDYPCPGGGFEPAPGQTLEEFLTEGAVWFTDNCSKLSVVIDADSVSNPQNYLFTSNLFTFTGSPDLATVCGFDGCITGTPQPAVTSGYYIMLKPLSKGQHTVHYHLEMEPWSIVQDGTFNITVQ